MQMVERHAAGCDESQLIGLPVCIINLFLSALTLGLRQSSYDWVQPPRAHCISKILLCCLLLAFMEPLTHRLSSFKVWHRFGSSVSTWLVGMTAFRRFPQGMGDADVQTRGSLVQTMQYFQAFHIEAVLKRISAAYKHIFHGLSSFRGNDVYTRKSATFYT
jgi:hypothetical protein